MLKSKESKLNENKEKDTKSNENKEDSKLNENKKKDLNYGLGKIQKIDKNYEKWYNENYSK